MRGCAQLHRLTIRPLRDCAAGILGPALLAAEKAEAAGAVDGLVCTGETQHAYLSSTYRFVQRQGASLDSSTGVVCVEAAPPSEPLFEVLPLSSSNGLSPPLSSPYGSMHRLSVSPDNRPDTAAQDRVTPKRRNPRPLLEEALVALASPRHRHTQSTPDAWGLVSGRRHTLGLVAPPGMLNEVV
jgi:hypothetical protein